MPRRRVGATQATRNADDDDDIDIGEEMDLDDVEEEATARRKPKGGAKRITAAPGLSSDVGVPLKSSLVTKSSIRKWTRRLAIFVGWHYSPNIAEEC